MVRLPLLVVAAAVAVVRGSSLAPLDAPAPRAVAGLPAVAHWDAAAWGLDADRPVGLPAGINSVLPTAPHDLLGHAKSHAGRARRAAPSPLRDDDDDVDDNDNYRLPQNIAPSYYELSLLVDVDNSTFMGKTSIMVHVRENTNTIVLHAASNLKFGLDTVTVRVFPNPGKAIPILGIKFVSRSEKYETVTIVLDKPLQKDKLYKITFPEFSSELLSGLHGNRGFYRTSYRDKDGTMKWLAATQFEPTYARKAFPCFDEPSFKAKFSVKIAHDRKYSTRSNMPGDTRPAVDGAAKTLNESSIMDDYDFTDSGVENPVISEFDPTVPMSTYLLAWVVSDFEQLKSDDGLFSTWARPGTVQGATLSQRVGTEALRLLGEYTGVPFVLPKVDQFAIPRFLTAAAMENWGLVTYSEEDLVMSENTDILSEHYMHTVICHELGHQWAGNLVTMDWWSHTWLNEGLATFFENLICDMINPNLKLMEKIIPLYSHIAMNADLMPGQHAMSSNVSDPKEIKSKFDEISYEKGATVIRMFQYILTPEVFQKGMQLYFSANKYRNTNPEHLFRALSIEAQAAQATGATVHLPDGVDFATVARTWTEQPGVPLVEVIRDYGKSTVTISQKQYLREGAHDEGRLWYIPITLVAVGASADYASTAPTVWLTPDTPSVTLELQSADEDAALLVNPTGIAYYRTLYDLENRKRLLAALKRPSVESGVPTATQAVILGDVFALAETNHVPWAEALSFLDMLTEQEAIGTATWLSAENLLNTLTDHLGNTDVYDSFQILKRRYTEAAYERLGLAVRDSDQHDDRYSRTYVAPWACEAGNPQCLSDASELLHLWLQKPDQAKLHPDTAEATLCYGVRASDAATFQAVKDVWVASKDKEQRSRMRRALYCSTDFKLVAGLLDELLTSGAWKAALIFMWELTDYVHHHRSLYEYFQKNWQTIDTFAGDAVLTLVLEDWIRAIRSDDDYEQTSAWVSKTFPESRPGLSELTSALADVNMTLAAWYRPHYRRVADYIYQATGTSPPSTTHSATDPTTDSSTGPATDQATDPTTDPATDSASDSGTSDPGTGPTTDTATDATTDSSTGPATDPATDPTSDPATDSATDPTTDSATDPAYDSGTDPTTDSSTGPATDPANHQTPDPTTDSSTGPNTVPSTHPTTDLATDPTTDSTTH